MEDAVRYQHEDAYRLGIGRALFAQGEYEEAVSQLRQVTGESKELAERNWHTDLVFSLLPYITSQRAYGPLKAWLGDQQQQAATRGRPHEELDSQAATLWLVRDCYWRLYRTPHGDPPPTEKETGGAGVTALTLILHPGLLPTQVAESSTGGMSEQVQKIQRRLMEARESKESRVDQGEIFRRVHRIQRKIKKDTGFLVPAPLIRSDRQLLPGTYKVLVHDVPVALGQGSGRIVLGTRYCADGQRCRELGLRGTWDAQGVWLPERAWKRASQAGLVLEEPSQVLSGRLERILRDQLPNFIGLQEMQALIDDWARHHADAPLPRQVATGGVAIRFVKVLRGLAAERVPVSELKLVCEIFTANDNAPVQEIISQIRLRLAPALPGCQRPSRLLSLSEAFEERIRAHLVGPAQQPLLLMTPAEAKAMIRAVQARAGNGRSSEDVAVVVRESRLRPYVRRLLATEMPHLPVLSMDELEHRPGGRATAEEIALPSDAGMA
jgi:FHIPEP family